MNDKISKIEWTDIFSIEIPSSWTFFEEDDVISIFDELNGVGVLQISFAKKNKSSNFISENTVVEFAENFLTYSTYSFNKKSLNTYLINGCFVSEMTLFQQETETNFWLVWHIQGNKRVACITYNCLLADRDIEVSTCKSIVKSFRWLS